MSLIYFSQFVANSRVLAYAIAMLLGLSATPGVAAHTVSGWQGETPSLVGPSKSVAKSTSDVPNVDYAFTLTNDTSVDMLEFYASPQTATDWEADILAGKIVQANGDWTIITLAGHRGCIYDFLAVFADGDKLEKYGINVCELETHTYYEN